LENFLVPTKISGFHFFIFIICNFLVFKLIEFFLFPQLFSYPSIGTVGGMSGVISPTNLSLFSSPVTVNSPRSNRHSTGTIQPRWNTQSAPSAPQPFITLDEDYMMTPLIAGTTAEANGSLMDDGEWLPHPVLFLSVACPGA